MNNKYSLKYSKRRINDSFLSLFTLFSVFLSLFFALLCSTLALAIPAPGSLPNPDSSLLDQTTTLTITPTQPLNNTIFSPGSVTFKADVSQSASCSLILDGVSVATSQTPLSFTKTIIQQGTHTWKITCNAQGAQNSSQELTFKVSSINPTITFDSQSKEPGSLLIVQLSGFSEQNDLEVEVIDTTLGSKLVRTSDEGKALVNWTLPQTLAQGTYTVVVVNYDNQSQSINKSFSVAYPQARLVAAKKIAYVNELVLVTGEKFLVNNTVTLDGKSYTTNSQGTFFANITRTNPQNVTLLAIQSGNSQINATYDISFSNEPINTTYYRDADGDGYGNLFQSKSSLFLPSGYVEDGTDCDDANKDVFPQAKEFCDGIDNDCDASIDEQVTCGDGKECRAGACVQITSSNVESPPPVVTNPKPTPSPTPTPGLDPYLESPENTSSSFVSWTLIFFLIIILLVGGFIGLMFYEGTLDTSSVEGFIQGVKDTFSPPQKDFSSSKKPFDTSFAKKDLSLSGASSLSTNFSSNLSTSSSQHSTLFDYITKKRKEGYDDLTIRNALLKQGWAEPEVDSMFDSLYHK